MEDLSLHILDVVENCITAEAAKISDNGKGMSEELLENATDPVYTTRTTRKVGLGIPLLAQSARESNGEISIKSKIGEGTSIKATFQYDHIDRKPLGDIGQTMIILIMSNPDIDFLFEHKNNDKVYTLDTAEMKKELDGIPINNPEVIKIINNDISAWLNSTDSM